jgi:two-component system, sensor histidine kinase and response regulator
MESAAMNVENPKPTTNPGSTTDRPSTRRAGVVFSQPLAWAVLVISLAGAGGGWHISRMHTELMARKQFDEETRRISAALKERMWIYQDVLHGAVGLFAASRSVERAEWRAYQESVSIAKRFPGIDGVGFIACVPRDKLDEFIKIVREDETPDFAVKNPGDSNELFIVRYIFPEDRHHSLPGRDFGIYPERRAAAEKARDTGASVISGMIPLLEEERTPQTGFVLLLPVYRNGIATDTVAERHKNIEGWVYARFVIAELMRGILENKSSTLRVELFDGVETNPAKLVFSEGGGRLPTERLDYQPLFSDSIPVGLFGRTWTLRFATNPAFDATISKTFSGLVGVGGVSISLLLFGIAWSLSRTRERALAIASDITATLRETNEQLLTESRVRQRAEQTLKDSEALYHSLVESLPLYILRKDLQGRFTFCNQRFCKEVSRSLKEILGKTDFDLFPRPLAEKHKVEEQQVMASGTTLETVEEFQAADGTTRFVQVIKTPVHDGDGHAIGLLGIFWDVTDKRTAEQALEYERYLLHTLMDNLPDRIYFKDAQSHFLRNNRAHLKMFGLDDPMQMVGKSDFDFFSEEHARQAYEDEQEIIRTGKLTIKEEKETFPDGRVTWVLSTKLPMRDESGRIIGTCGTSRDITELKQAQDKLAAERNLLRSLMENLPAFVYVKDTQGRYLMSNLAHLRYLGLNDPGQIVGKTVFDLFPRELAERFHADDQAVLSFGQPVLNREEQATDRNGNLRWNSTSKVPLRDAQGRIVGLVGISHDVTERRQAEEAIQRAREAAEEANLTKSRFLASMSHELRTPLNSVIGFANILLKNKAGNLSSSELNFLDRIQANGKHLLGLINEILDLSKIEAHKIELQFAPVALDALVCDTIAQQEGLLRDRPVKLLADVPAIVAPISTDADKLKQVIINLIGNALKFTERGSVTVRVVTNPADHHPVRIDVIDTGIGIPSDKLGVIFEAFQQADASMARKYGGTGLGLTISQALCQLMGYRIEVASKVGQGSTFSVVLNPRPAAVSATTPALALPQPAAAPPLPAVDLKGKLVLVIDDESDSRLLLTHMLEEFGCQVIAANSGEQGLRMAREFHPQIITVDLLMPRMDGWEVLRAIKADPELRDIPAAVVSLVASEHCGRILDAVDVLQKPVTREDLLAVLQRNLSGPKPKILVVDDEEDARRLIIAHLEDEPVEIRTAANGREALDLLEVFSPDLILLDLMMPVMDGMAFLYAIRGNPRHHKLPVVVISAKELTPQETEQLCQQTQEVFKKADVFGDDLKQLLRGLLKRPPGKPASPLDPRAGGHGG